MSTVKAVSGISRRNVLSTPDGSKSRRGLY
nr:MAG TPA: hypothetical protein [Caudoviricetes sp.]